MTIHVPKTVPEQKGDPCHSEESEAARNLGKDFNLNYFKLLAVSRWPLVFSAFGGRKEKDVYFYVHLHFFPPSTDLSFMNASMAKSGPSTRSGTTAGELVKPSPRPYFHQLMKWVCPSSKPGRFPKPSGFLRHTLRASSLSKAPARTEKNLRPGARFRERMVCLPYWLLR